MVRCHRRTGRWLTALVACSLPWLLQASAEPDRPLEERAEAARVLVETRVLDARGEPIPGLSASDFSARLDGNVVRVESAAWVTGALPDPDRLFARPPGTDIGATGADEATLRNGRLIVLLFQRDLLASRIVGLMRMRDDVEAFLRELSPTDRVALLVHDVKLHLYSDFTTDHDALLGILSRSIVFQRPPPRVSPGPFPSMVEHYDRQAAAEAHSAEAGIVVIAEALRALPGSKSILFFGWSMDRHPAGPLTTVRALKALNEGRVSIFSLDVTMADAHSLEGPLRAIAAETGGFYVKTYRFPALAMRRVTRAIDGHYELSLVKPNLAPGLHTIEIRLLEQPGVVYHRAHYVD